MSDAKHSPSRHFATPAAVLETAGLSRAEKIEILGSWANEVRQQQVAEEENMPNHEDLTGKLAAIDAALLALDAESPDHDSKS